MTIKSQKTSREEFMKKHGFGSSADAFKKRHDIADKLNKEPITAEQFKANHEFPDGLVKDEKAEVAVILANENAQEIERVKQQVLDIGATLDLAEAEVIDEGVAEEVVGGDIFNDYTPSSQRPDGTVVWAQKYNDTRLGPFRKTLSNRLDTTGFHRGALQLHNIQQLQSFGGQDTSTDWSIYPAQGWPYYAMDSNNSGELNWTVLDDDDPRKGRGRYRSLELTEPLAKVQVANFQSGLVNGYVDTIRDRLPIRSINHIIGSPDTGKTEIFWPLLSDILKDVKVAVDENATADYIGATADTGVLRVDTVGINYTDGGDFVTLQHWDKCDTKSNIDTAGVFYGITLDTLGHVGKMYKRTVSGMLPPGNNRYEVLSWNADGLTASWQPDWVRAHS